LVFWLLQGERDGGTDEVECLPLFAGRLGEHVGAGGQVAEQAAEAAVGPTGWVLLDGGFGLGGGAAGWCDRGCLPEQGFSSV
jgi:hypothetical protein